MRSKKRAKRRVGLQTLRRARKLLATPGVWAKGWYAFTASGSRTEPESVNARKFCALGALYHIGGSASEVAAGLLRDDDEIRLGVAFFNDEQETVGPVLALYDRAIAKLEAQ